MFSFSRRRMKIGRVKKVQLSDSSQGVKSPVRPTKRNSNSNVNETSTASSHHSNENCRRPAAPETRTNSSGSSDNWMMLSVGGDRPAPRFNHAAVAIGNKMIVIGGESGNGLLDDVQVLNFDNFAWTAASSKVFLSPSSLPLKVPAWKGHCLVSWGKKVLLVGGKTDPGSDRVSVWAFDTDSECWSLLEAKGDIPIARSGHTVVRASSILILFGGEDAKRRKLNDLHMFDLKSWTWLPLNCTGTRPCPRCNHVAALYDDKVLYIFGGKSKSRTLSDLYSLDFETMVWSRVKIRGFHPSPRAGCCGVLLGTKWYIAGGGSKKKRHAETLVFDILKVEWSSVSVSSPSSITSNKGFSLVRLQHKDKDFLVAFGGFKREPSNQVEVLIIEKNESPEVLQSTSELVFGKRTLSSSILANELGKGSSQRSIDSAIRQNLASVVEHHGSGRKSMSDISLVDTYPASGNVSLRRQFHNEEEYNAASAAAKASQDESSIPGATERGENQLERGNQSNNPGSKIMAEERPAVLESESLHSQIQSLGSIPTENLDVIFPETDSKTGCFSGPSSVYQFYEAKMGALMKRNGVLEGQLAAALAGREAAEKNLAAALRNKQEIERRLADTARELEVLKGKLAGVELAQEEANNLSNIVHSDNIRLEHDVAFLKAVLDDTQKELHSTRGALAGERGRAFQLQVEVFHLKQRLQSLENRAPTPRKPFHV